MRLKHRSIRMQLHLMGFPSVVERRAAANGKTHCASYAADAAVEIVIPAGIGREPDGHEILEFGDSVREQKTRHQDVRGRPVELFTSDPLCNWRDLEPASLAVIENGAEQTWGVEVRITVPVDGPVHAYHRDGTH